jgi:glycosyltransferase involved in cell wall biosynthesis
MAVHNGERYLREAIESILHQTFGDFELIIVDDGSTDSSPDVFTRYQKSEDRLRVYQQENQGLTVSLNKALGLARGKYIARMDADDISLPERFSEQIGFLEAHREVGLVGSWAQYIDHEGCSLAVWQNAAEHGCLKWRLCFNNVFAHSSVMMRRDVVQGVGGYDLALRYSQDYDLWCRMSDVARLSSIQKVLVLFRLHGEKVSEVHKIEQKRSSLGISQRVVSALLERDIPVEMIKSFRKELYGSIDDALRYSKTLNQLYEAFVHKNQLAAREKHWIRRDAARMLWKMARPKIRDPRVWQVMRLACKLNPLLSLSIAMAPVRRFAAMLQLVNPKGGF